MKLKKILQIVVITLIIIFAYSNLSIATNTSKSKVKANDFTEEYKKWLQLSDEEKKNTVEPIAYEVKYNNSINFFSTFRTFVGDTDLERTYDLRNYGQISSIKNQYNTNLCWAFSTLSVLESNLAKKTNKTYDFSETHLAYGTSAISTTNNKRGFYKQADSVGNFPKAIAYLTNGLGAVEESEMPFVTTYSSKDISDITNIKPVTKIEDTIEFEPISENLNSSKRTSQINKIKKHIKENGAVYSSIRSIEMSNQLYYNEENSAFYYNGENLVDHAVTIVGWDDTYSKNNFNTKPRNDGAWIVRNSWGTDWGDDGYFYVSYEDTQIGKYMSGIINASTTIDYDNLYQYDELGASGWVYFTDSEKVYGANVFKKSKNTELLKEVSVSIGQEEYVKVFVNPKNSSRAKQDLIEISEYELLEPGYHTIKLDKEVALTGNEFVVVVEHYLPNGIAIAQTERKYDTGEYSVVVQNPGESYITNDLSIDNGWEESQYGNLTIKAFTVNAEDTDIFELTDSSITPATVYTNNNGTINASIKTKYVPDNAKFDITIMKGDKNVTEKFIVRKNIVKDNIGNIEISILPKMEAGEYLVNISYGELLESETIKFSIEKFVLEKGDLNGSGTIDATDLLLLKRHIIAGSIKGWILVEDYFEAGDLNSDGVIDSTDLLLMKREVIKSN